MEAEPTLTVAIGCYLPAFVRGSSPFQWSTLAIKFISEVEQKVITVGFFAICAWQFRLGIDVRKISNGNGFSTSR